MMNTGIPLAGFLQKKKKTIELIMFDRVEMVIWIIQEQIQLRIIIKIK